MTWLWPANRCSTTGAAADNDVARQLCTAGNAAEVVGLFDIVVANILAAPLIQFAESITSTIAGRGMLALSGVLCEQADDVMAAYEPWVAFDGPSYKEQDGRLWSRLTGTRRAS